MKKILLIGSSGFIGSYLKKDLKDKYKLICPSNRKNFDITNYNKVNNVLKKNVDIIINLSGQISKSQMYETIIKGNTNIIKATKKLKRRPKIFYISTTLVYGFSNKILDESSRTNPYSKYAKFKKKGEELFLKSNLDYKILRLANVYDQDKKGIVKNIINSIIKKKKLKVTNLNASRNYIHVEDFSKIILRMLESRLKFKLYNVVNENFTIKQIIEFIEKRLKLKVDIYNYNNKLKLLSSQKIKIGKIYKEIDFQPKIKLKSFILNKLKNEIKFLKK